MATLDDVVVTRWLDGIAGRGARAQALMLLKTIVHFAVSRGLCSAPTITLKAGAARRVQNFLKPEELRRLDAALIELANEKPFRVMAFAAIRLMIATGCRKGEVLALERDWVDLDHRIIRLPRHKGSDEGRDVLLCDTAVAILKSVPVIHGAKYVFFGRGDNLQNIAVQFREALKRAGLRRIRPHDIRHSYASAAIAQGTSLYVVGQLLGHRDLKTTARYSHLSRNLRARPADKVADAWVSLVDRSVRLRARHFGKLPATMKIFSEVRRFSFDLARANYNERIMA